MNFTTSFKDEISKLARMRMSVQGYDADGAEMERLTSPRGSGQIMWGKELEHLSPKISIGDTVNKLTKREIKELMPIISEGNNKEKYPDNMKSFTDRADRLIGNNKAKYYTLNVQD